MMRSSRPKLRALIRSSSIFTSATSALQPPLLERKQKKTSNVTRPCKHRFIKGNTRSSKQRKAGIYELALTCVDIAACVTLLPLYPLLDGAYMGSCRRESHISNAVFPFLQSIAVTSYLGVLELAAVDRFNAVFYPLKYRRKPIRFPMTALAVNLALSLLIASCNVYIQLSNDSAVYNIVVSVVNVLLISCFMAMVGLYMF